VLVDFFAEWCAPCQVLGPLLEKLSEEFSGKFILVKANLDEVPGLAQKFEIDRIPAVIFFKNGKPAKGFVGLLPEATIKKWLEENLSSTEDSDISLIQELKQYASQHGFQLNPDEPTVQRIIKGLIANQQKYSQRYCPCRRITGDKKTDKKNICPCIYHLAEIKENGHCFCGLFVDQRE